MDSSNGQQHQEQQLQAHNSLDMLVSSSKSNQQQSAVVDNRKPRPQAEQSLKCPRCDSTNTKFCYYNNYSLTQPRYFCKSCRRYWTKGGTLRNVPVGGGCRKNHKRSSKRSSSQDPHPNPLTPNPSSNPLLLPSFAYDSNDLSAAFARLQRSCIQMGYDDHYINSMLTNSTSTNSHSDILSNCSSPVPSSGFLDALRTGFLETHNGNGFAHNLYYGFGSNNMVDMENGGCGEMGLQPYEELSNNNNVAATTAVTVTKMKQEMSRDIDETNNKVLWGFPWQMNNGDHESLNMGVGVQHEYESSGRESWNGIVNPSWHGILPLV